MAVFRVEKTKDFTSSECIAVFEGKGAAVADVVLA